MYPKLVGTNLTLLLLSDFVTQIFQDYVIHQKLTCLLTIHKAINRYTGVKSGSWCFLLSTIIRHPLVIIVYHQWSGCQGKLRCTTTHNIFYYIFLVQHKVAYWLELHVLQFFLDSFSENLQNMKHTGLKFLISDISKIPSCTASPSQCFPS